LASPSSAARSAPCMHLDVLLSLYLRKFCFATAT
jgi:hypothetical protein